MARQALSKDMNPYLPITLYDFSREDDAVDAERIQEKDQDAWRISDDRVIGGFSQSSATLIRSDNNNNAEKNKNETKDNNHFLPFIRWSGTIDTTIGLTSNVQRSGFAALRSPQFPMDGANLKGMYDALELTCRSDGRLYTVNLKVSTAFPDDIYQGYLKDSNATFDSDGNLSSPFDTLVLPFEDFTLSKMGGTREVSRELDDKICIESVGVALMDGEDGDFQFDLARIRVVNLLDGKVYDEKKPDATQEDGT